MKNLKKAQQHYNFKLTDSWGIQDFYIWEETTADGYSVYIATDNPDKINVNENVHYYDSDLSHELIEFIKHSSKLDETIIYVDDLDAVFIDEAIQELIELIKEPKTIEND